jgi:uncharacterized metal-binding protein YceD (DUF177 family)
MNALREFSIPIKGLKNGFHQFEFQIDKSFFSHFDGSPIADGEFQVWLDFDKQTSLFELTFEFEGAIKTACDRCLADINLPVDGLEYLTVKLTLDPKEEEADIIYISPEDPELNVAKYIYEYICLALPTVMSYDCENDEQPPCDFATLKKLEENAVKHTPSVTEEKETEDAENPFLNLKKLFNNN